MYIDRLSGIAGCMSCQTSQTVTLYPEQLRVQWVEPASQLARLEGPRTLLQRLPF